MSKTKDTKNPISNFSTQEGLSGEKHFSKREIFLSRVKRRFLKHVWVARVVLFSAVVLGIYILVVGLGLIFRNLGIFKYTRFAYDFAFPKIKNIETSGGRTNVLILGKAGEGNTAPDLTDTIILASISHNNPQITLVSLPRDIWIPSLRAKLNSTYYWGNQKREGGGLILAKSSAEEVVGEPVHYGVVIDFSGFVKVVDILGGIEVDIERAFTDEFYPIAGREDDECDGDPEFNCRYETISFSSGPQTIDGETALKFVRSRNAEGDEGTDIARAKRQQKILASLKKKILSPGVFFSPEKVSALIEIAKTSIETDIAGNAAAVLLRRILDTGENINSYVLPEELLFNPPKSFIYDNLYVFVPIAEGWEEVHGWVDCVLAGGSCEPGSFVNR